MGICEVAKGGESINYVIITGILVLAVYSDLRTFKIPNFLCGIGCLMGLIYMFVEHGVAGMRKSFLGILLPIISMFILFCIRVIGAGDIKLFSAIGAFISKDIIWVILISFLLTGIYGIFLYLKKVADVIHKRMTGEISVIRVHAFVGELTIIHFSISIAIGTWIYFFKELLI